jgi:hypothetical protein
MQALCALHVTHLHRSSISSDNTRRRTPLCRLYNGASDDHSFTVSADERDIAIASYGYRYEGTAGYVLVLW